MTSILQKIKAQQAPGAGVESLLASAQEQLRAEAWKKLQPQVDTANNKASMANERAAAAEAEAKAAEKRASEAESKVAGLMSKISELEARDKQHIAQLNLEAGTVNQVRDRAEQREERLRSQVDRAKEKVKKLEVQNAELRGKLEAKPKVVEKVKTISVPATRQEIPEFEAVPIKGPNGIERVKIRPVRTN